MYEYLYKVSITALAGWLAWVAASLLGKYLSDHLTSISPTAARCPRCCRSACTTYLSLSTYLCVCLACARTTARSSRLLTVQHYMYALCHLGGIEQQNPEWFRDKESERAAGVESVPTSN